MTNPILRVLVAVIVGSAVWWERGATAPTTTTTTGTAALERVLEGCKNNPADIYFLLDCSSSVWIVDFDKQLQFVVSLVERLDTRPNATRVGLGVFSNDFYHQLDIGDYPDSKTLTRFIKSAPYYTGNTYTGKGLQGMRTHGFRAGVARPNATKIGVVITDGRSRHRSNTMAEATLAKEAHIWLFAIGVGNSVDREELSAIASVPKKQFSYHVQTFDVLASLTDTVARSMCLLEQPQSDGAVCGQKVRGDVMFVYNAGSMAPPELLQVREFIGHLVGQFSMATGNVRVGVLSEGSQGGDITLEQYIRSQDFIQALMKLPKARLGPLFKKLRVQGFDPQRGGRPNAKKIVIAFVNDAMEDRNDVLFEALLLKYDDALIHVVSLGDNVDKGEVKQLATAPDYIKQFALYSDLESPQRRKDFVKMICQHL
ncbi:matrilin-1-like [Babylonia areolata]|uniref:matrilin-1-like n=1 Tax=Babylonia areolata TaxID=304850 RepID=UPI003FD581D9